MVAYCLLVLGLAFPSIALLRHIHVVHVATAYFHHCMTCPFMTITVFSFYSVGAHSYWLRFCSFFFFITKMCFSPVPFANISLGYSSRNGNAGS